MSRFKVGDRVRVYGGIPLCDDIVKSGEKGLVIRSGLSGRDGDLDVEFSEGNSWNVFSQQCRKLKPKEKPITVFIEKKEMHKAFANGNGALAYQKGWNDPEFDFTWVEFREVRKK